MICLFDTKKQNDFKKDYKDWSAKTIVGNIPDTIETVLKEEDIPFEKIKLFKDRLFTPLREPQLQESDTLKLILNELKKNVIPLFQRKSNHDIIGKFYEELLRYAGIANVKKLLVIRPYHVTNLVTELRPKVTVKIVHDA